MSPTVLTVLTFLAAILSFLAVYSIVADLFFRDRLQVHQRMDEEFRQRQRAQAQRSPLVRALRKPNGEASGENQAAPPEQQPPQWLQRYRTMIDQSGVEVTPTRLPVIALGLGIGLGLLAGLLSGSLPLGLVVGLVFLALPFCYVQRRRTRRLNKLLTQLPDALDLIARVVRAGQTMAQAMRAVADEFEDPIATEFAYCYEQQDLGLPPEIALRDMARRTGLLEMKIFVLGIIVQRQTGGNLAIILENLAAVVRERFRVRDKIMVLTAEGRLQANVLLALPPLMFLVMLFLNPNYTDVLLAHPYYLLAMFVSMAFGTLWIRKIVHFDY